MPLEQLNEKDFNKKEMQIQLPYEVNTQDDEEHWETNTRQLYLKFVDMMSKDEMQILYQKPGGNREQVQNNAE